MVVKFGLSFTTMVLGYSDVFRLMKNQWWLESPDFKTTRLAPTSETRPDTSETNSGMQECRNKSGFNGVFT